MFGCARSSLPSPRAGLLGTIAMLSRMTGIQCPDKVQSWVSPEVLLRRGPRVPTLRPQRHGGCAWKPPDGSGMPGETGE